MENQDNQIKVIYDGMQVNLSGNVTLREFIEYHAAHSDEGYLVNGEAKPLDTVLGNYNVIEESEDGTYLEEYAPDNSGTPDLPETKQVEVHLSGFSGPAGKVWTADNVAALKENYNQPVAITVIRDNEKLPDTNDFTKLKDGDVCFAMPAGGVKGA